MAKGKVHSLKVKSRARKCGNRVEILVEKMQFSLLNEKLSICVLIWTAMHFIAMCDVCRRKVNGCIGKPLGG
jgi:hypothetical protein